LRRILSCVVGAEECRGAVSSFSAIDSGRDVTASNARRVGQMDHDTTAENAERLGPESHVIINVRDVQRGLRSVQFSVPTCQISFLAVLGKLRAADKPIRYRKGIQMAQSTRAVTVARDGVGMDVVRIGSRRVERVQAVDQDGDGDGVGCGLEGEANLAADIEVAREVGGGGEGRGSGVNGKGGVERLGGRRRGTASWRRLGLHPAKQVRVH